MARVGCRFAVALILAAALAVPTSSQAAFPGANGKIAFVGAPPGLGPYEIHTVNPDGTARGPLVPDAGAYNDWEPEWSADGRKLAFSRGVSGQHIATINGDGTGLNILPLEGSTPAWSPDGRRLAYSFREDIWAANADGRYPVRLTDAPAAGGGDPSWSPDGRRIAFVSARDGNWEIYVMDAGGRNETRLTRYTGFDSAPDWSPDGRRILFLRSRPGGDDLVVIDPDSAGETVLANGDGGAQRYRHPVWSPDGSKIATAALCCGGRGLLRVMNADGTSPVELGTEFGFDPTWQPIPGPRRLEYKNGSQFCKAEEAFLGSTAFRHKYGTNGNGANANGKCVSRNH